MKVSVMAAVVVTTIAIGGCAGNRGFIEASSITTRNNVFNEAQPGGPPPPGYADLSVTSSLKTHKAGRQLKTDAHGTVDYQLLLNVDGQVIRLRPRTADENIEPRRLRDPEAGDGTRHEFATRIRLKAGAHRIVVVSPEDGIAVEREVVLSEGRGNRLELDPVYGTAASCGQPAYYGATSFLGGVTGFRFVLSGNP